MKISGKTKKILIAVIAVILVLNIASRVISLGFLKSQIEKQATEASGFDVTVSDKIHVGMRGILPSFVLNDITAEDRDSRMKIEAKVLEGAIPLSANPKKFDLSIEKLTIDGRAIGDYQFVLHRVGNGIDIPDLKGQLFDARLKGPFSYHDGKMDMDIKVTDLDYSEFAKGMTGGKVKIDLKLQGAGEDSRSITRTLKGNALLMGGEGRMTGNAVNLWASNVITGILSNVKGGSDTAILCTVADFTVDKGIARSKAIIIDTEHVVIFGKGQIDLAAGRMDMVFTPQPKNKTILSLATAMHVSGRIENPQVTPEANSALKKIGGLFLTTINPAMAFLPMFEEGKNTDKPCAAYLSAKEAK